MRTRRDGDAIIEADPEACLAVILDVESYPRWVRGYRFAEVTTLDEHERPTVVAFEVGGFGMTARYSLEYTYSADPLTVSFRQMDGSLTRAIEGRYLLEPVKDESTRVRYSASVELAMPIPRLMRGTAERIVMDAALRSLRGEVLRRS